MTFSKHYSDYRKEREEAIQQIGLGEVIHESIEYCEKKHRNYRYLITSTAILIVMATDDPNYMVSRYPARPSRIKRHWEDAPQEIIEISVKHTRMGLTF